MRRGMMSNVADRLSSRSAKMIAVNRKYGNENIGDQQGTTRQIYHALPLDGRQVFQFFKQVQSGTGLAGEVGTPWNNIEENKLQVGESLDWYRFRIEALILDEMDDIFTEITDLATAGVPEIYGGDYGVTFDTKTVMKPNPLSSQMPVFSKNAWHTTNEWIEFDSEIVLIPKINFQLNLIVPTYTPVANARIRCVVEGFGSILSSMGQV